MTIPDIALNDLKQKLDKVSTVKLQHHQAKEFLLFCIANYENNKNEEAENEFKKRFIRFMYLAETITDLNLLDACILLNEIFNIEARQYKDFETPPESELTRMLIKTLFKEVSYPERDLPSAHNFFILSIHPSNAVRNLLSSFNENSIDFTCIESNLLIETSLLFAWDDVFKYFLQHWDHPNAALFSFLKKSFLIAEGPFGHFTHPKHVEASIAILEIIIEKLLNNNVLPREIIHAFPTLLEVAALRKWAPVIALLLFDKNHASILNRIDENSANLHDKLLDLAMTEAPCQASGNFPIPENRIYDTVQALIFAGATIEERHINAAAKQNHVNVLGLLIALAPHRVSNHSSNENYVTAPTSPVLLSRSQSEHVTQKNSLHKSLASD